MSALAGKVALVTGGSRGIGRAIARHLASEGAAVGVCARTMEAAQAVAAELAAAGAESLAQQADVADPEQAAAAVEATVAALGGLDILVNNAGIARDSLLARMRAEDWDAVMATNLRGAFNCCKAAVRPMLRARAGRIINISSVVGIQGNAGQSNYAASKAGLIGFTKSLARELAARRITVNAVAPGLVPETGMTGKLPAGLVEKMVERIPLRRPGTPEEVAWAVGFMASERAAYITGQVLQVDGGMAI